MTEKDDKFDEELADITQRLVALGSPDRMKMALYFAKISLKEKETKDKVVAKKKESSLLLHGNSTEKIVQLEEDYDFSGVSVGKEREQAKKWFMAVQPPSTRNLGTEFKKAYYVWTKWNLTNTDNHGVHYQGHLVRKREEEEEEEEEREESEGEESESEGEESEGEEVGAAMAAVRLE
jgi:hypothetical protein